MIQREEDTKKMSTLTAYWCNYCATAFKSNRYLCQHQARAKSCQKYRDALFCCQRCGIFRTKGIKNFNTHLKTCIGVQPSTPNQCSLVEKLRTELAAEKARSNIYLALLASHSDISTDKILLQKNEGIHLFNIKPKMKIFLHEVLPTEQFNTIESKYEDLSRASSDSQRQSCSYRRAPKQFEDNPELTRQDRSLLIDQIDRKNKETLKQLDKDKASTISNACQEFINQLPTSRVYTKILKKLRVERSKLLGTLRLDEYRQVVKTHTEQLYKIFHSKQQSDKKIRSNVLNSLTPIEARLMRYPGYTDTHLDAKCRERLETVVRHGRICAKEFEIYALQQLSDKLTTYSVAVFPIEKLIKWALINPYCFWNVVYLAWPKSNTEDPYSFYVLRKIKKGKRYWNMNCRLEDFTTDLIACIQPYLVQTFRELYYAVFSDNGYRPNCMELSPFVAEDCEQLARNIILLSQPRKLCGKLRKLLTSECTYKHTCKDNFSLLGDDPLQRKRFQKKEKIEMVSTVTQLFDQITDEQAVNFYKSRNVA